jgi:hypothetical protein
MASFLSGKDFNEIYNQRTFYKVLADSMVHHDLKYIHGLNIDIAPFFPSSLCACGGIYFTDAEHIYLWLTYRSDLKYICKVTIPPDAKVFVEDFKFKADRVLLDLQNKTLIEDFPHIHWDNIVKSCGFCLKYVKSQTPEICEMAVKQNGFALQFVHPDCNTEALQRLAVEREGLALRYIEKPTPALALFAIQQNGLAIEFVKHPTDEMKETAVKQNGLAIFLIKRPSEVLKLWAVQQNGLVIRFIKKPSPTCCCLAISQNPKALLHIANLTPIYKQINGSNLQYVDLKKIWRPSVDFILQTIEHNGLAIRFLRHPSPEIQLQVVKQNGLALQFIRNPSPEVQSEAVKQNGLALQFAKTPLESDATFPLMQRFLNYFQSRQRVPISLQIEALKQNGLSIQFIKKPSEEMQEIAVRQNGLALQFLPRASESIRLLALKQNPLSLQFIAEQTIEHHLIALRENTKCWKYVKNPSETLYQLLF